MVYICCVYIDKHLFHVIYAEFITANLLCRGHKLYGTMALFSPELQCLVIADRSQSGPFFVLHSVLI